jgi:hypothetical protein
MMRRLISRVPKYVRTFLGKLYVYYAAFLIVGVVISEPIEVTRERSIVVLAGLAVIAAGEATIENNKQRTGKGQ